MDKNQNIEALIIKSLERKANPNEMDELQTWRALSKKNELVYNTTQRLWEQSKKLVLSNTIDLNLALTQTKNQIPEFHKKKRWIFSLAQIAAIFLIALALSFFYHKYLSHNNTEVSEQTVFQEINTSCGTQTNLTLPDGTVVWLNSGSTLRFPMSFKNQANRSVELRGEGYFKVTKNSQQPFIVVTKSIKIKVLGTSFNVSAYENDPEITVALVEGKIALLKDINGEEKKLLELNPMEAANYYPDKNQIAQFKVDLIDKYTAWKDGRIVFYNDPIAKVVTRLENWYNVEIDVADSTLNKYHFTATFVDESLEQVLKLLSLSSPMKYQIISAKKNKDNSYGRRQIILARKK